MQRLGPRIAEFVVARAFNFIRDGDVFRLVPRFTKSLANKVFQLVERAA